MLCVAALRPACGYFRQKAARRTQSHNGEFETILT